MVTSISTMAYRFWGEGYNAGYADGLMEAAHDCRLNAGNQAAGYLLGCDHLNGCVTSTALSLSNTCYPWDAI
jgi:hypothetical protein